MTHPQNNKSWEEGWIKERTDAISEMFDNVDENGIYPTTKLFKRLDKYFHSTLNKEILENERITEEWYEKEYIPKAIKEERNRLIEKVEQRINTKQHICSFNDGESACACYNQAISDILTILKEDGKN